MEQHEIEKLVHSNIFPDHTGEPMLVETHISWVILTKKHAYKIKKPIQYSFLDFSTLEKRKYFCKREVKLNKRLAEKMYIKATPIFITEGEFSFNKNDGDPIDYAVKMNRMDAAREMGKLLKKNHVTPGSIKTLAKKIAVFHQNAVQINEVFEISDFQQKYNDILTIKDFASKHLGRGFTTIIQQAVEKSDRFLRKNIAYLQERSLSGFTRDIHGDLHSGNIFLYKDPIIFDCIEFNDSFRQIDVLDEIAFFCMDLEAFHRYDLSDIFYRKYVRYSGIKETKESKQLFNYYKGYRANVRAKINALNAMQSPGRELKVKNKIDAEKYLKLLKSYSGI